MQSILVAALIVSAFFIGMLYTKVRVYEKSGVPTGLAAAGANKPSAVPQAPQAPVEIKLNPITDIDHVRGNRNARVALVEYSDLECPFCKSFHPTAKRALETYGDQLMWVFRHFPLSQIHAKAQAEAEAAECAAKLGGENAFWSFIDKVYEITPGNDGLDPAQLPIIATGLGINVDQFKACQTSKETAARVNSDYESGVTAGINGTPGNVLLDTKTGKTLQIPGAVPYEQLKSAIDGFIAGLE